VGSGRRSGAVRRATIGQGFGQMRAPDPASAVEISERAGELEHPVIAARRKTQTFGRLAQQAKTGVVCFRDLLDQIGRRGRVAGDAVEAEIGVARKLNLARGGDPRGDLRGAFARRRRHQIGRRNRRNLDREVEAIEKRPRKAPKILSNAALIGRPTAGKTGLVGRAAAAGVHCRHELEARGIDHAVVGARDGDFAKSI
jgi:hypothetical protein